MSDRANDYLANQQTLDVLNESLRIQLASGKTAREAIAYVTGQAGFKCVEHGNVGSCYRRDDGCLVMAWLEDHYRARFSD